MEKSIAESPNVVVDDKNEGERKYNFIYDDLVKDDFDITGMIAYSLYKRDKVKFIQATKDEKGSFSDADLDGFHRLSKIAKTQYEDRAVLLFTSLTNEIVSTKVKLSHELIKEIVEETASPKGFRNWARAITQSLIAAIIFTVMVFFFYLYISFKTSGDEERAKLKFDKTINSTFKTEKDSVQ